MEPSLSFGLRRTNTSFGYEISFSILRTPYFWHFYMMFKHQIRVAYRDVTVGNHIYYARYLDLLEIARNEAFRSLGLPLLAFQEQGILFPVIECTLRYHEAARYDDLIDIETVVADLGKVQFTLAYRLLRGKTLLFTATTRHASTSLAEKPIRMPSSLHGALLLHLV